MFHFKKILLLPFEWRSTQRWRHEQRLGRGPIRFGFLSTRILGTWHACLPALWLRLNNKLASVSLRIAMPVCAWSPLISENHGDLFLQKGVESLGRGTSSLREDPAGEAPRCERGTSETCVGSSHSHQLHHLHFLWKDSVRHNSM